MTEVSASQEISEEKNAEAENYKKIKPENGMTIEEATCFWDTIFDSEIDADETYYYDDNGKLYRVGKELAPNSEYEINGYKYRTDGKGRIISAEGILHRKDREGRLTIKDSIDDIGKGDQQEGDDRGHLIGDQFDGTNGLENMIPQDAKINQTDFKSFENELAREMKSGKEVFYKAEPIYEGDSRRPVAVAVTYRIDGKESVRIFPNGKEEQTGG